MLQIEDEHFDVLLGNNMTDRPEFLSSFFPLDREDVPATTADHVLELASCLQSSTEVVSILTRHGGAELLTKAESLVVNEALFECSQSLGAGKHHWDNVSISVALLRRHLSGVLDLSDYEKSIDFVNARLRTFRFDDDTTRPDVRMKLSEMLEIFAAFSTNFPELIEHMNEIHGAEDKAPYHDDPDAENDNVYWTVSAETGLGLSIGLGLFGFANRDRRDIEQLTSVFIEYAFRNNPESLDETSVLNSLRKPANMQRYKLRENQNIDEVLPRYIDDLIVFDGDRRT